MDNLTNSSFDIEGLQNKHPELKSIMNLDPVFWINPKTTTHEKLKSTNLTKDDIFEAEKRWQRFTPFLIKSFPELIETNGIIESPLKEIPKMKTSLINKMGANISGDLYLKCDNELPIAGSIKARGGFYEVLYYAEKLAIDAGLINKDDNYEKFATKELKEFFSQYTIGVGSTGNLGLSIGIMSAKLGFRVNVYMSADARQWKKDLLRKKGAFVHEFTGDFSEAINTGRQQTIENPKGYFVDDEDSEHLFMGYSTAGSRLAKQLKDKGIKIDEEHPLFMYLPCGVGGSPGGVMFGLKQIFGKNVHCFFVEPTKSPAVLTGLLTGERENICVQDIGIDNQTEADGLAVGRPSKFATIISEELVSGVYTIKEDVLFTLLTMLADSEDIYIEPSATAGLLGPGELVKTNYMKDRNINPENVTHIAWSTGGELVPEEEMRQFYNRGIKK